MPAWAGLWNGVYQEDHSLIGLTNPGRRLARAIGRQRQTARVYNELLRTLVTDDVGSTAASTITRAAAESGADPGMSLGGVRSIETVAVINRAVTVDDETAILRDIDNDHTPTFPTEKSGNSGGGKLGF